MTLFAIYERQPAIPAAVAEKFSWLAFLLPPVFAMVHGLWLELAIYVIKVAALSVLSRFIGGDAAFWLYALLALWIGFAAPALLRAKLTRSGWRHRSDRIAPAADLALLSFLDRP